MDYKHYRQEIVNHYELAWGNPSAEIQWKLGPRADLPPEFSTLVFAPRAERSMWTYATVCMSLPFDNHGLELHIFSSEPSELHVELLTVIAHYHRTESRLTLGSTVNFGRPWFPGSSCSFGLISLPYLDGPELEILEMNESLVSFYWLIPITQREREYKKVEGLDALEQAFQGQNFNYLDPFRQSVV